MIVTMVRVREMLVAVRQRLMPVAMGMADPRRDRRLVFMLMMLIVFMFVLVFHGLVGMLVTMVLGDVQPHAQRHERTCDQQPAADGFVQHQDSEPSTEEWRH